MKRPRATRSAICIETLREAFPRVERCVDTHGISLCGLPVAAMPLISAQRPSCADRIRRCGFGGADSGASDSPRLNRLP